MADQAKEVFRAGTPVVFGVAAAVVGGLTVTHALSLDNLAAAAAQMSAEADLGTDDLPEFFTIEGYVETGIAPVAGGVVEYYLAQSRDGTNYPGKVSGTNGAYAAGAVAATKLQLGVPCVSVIATADANTVLMQDQKRWPCFGRFIAAVIVNLISQLIRNETTDSDNNSGLVVTPWYRFAIDP